MITRIRLRQYSFGRGRDRLDLTEGVSGCHLTGVSGDGRQTAITTALRRRLPRRLFFKRTLSTKMDPGTLCTPRH